MRKKFFTTACKLAPYLNNKKPDINMKKLT